MHGADAFRAIKVTGGSNGATKPAGINTNETLYIIRHADAHPLAFWTDGNYVCAGQWRALDLPNALRGKISPQQVYSSDPAADLPGHPEFVVGCCACVDRRTIRDRQ